MENLNLGKNDGRIIKPFHTFLEDMSIEECSELLTRNSFCHLGCTDGNEVYVVPMSYVYEDGMFYCHSREGKKLDFLRTKLFCCIQVEEIENFYHWKSVAATCEYTELDGDEALRSMRLLINRLEQEHKITPLEEDFASYLQSSVMFKLKVVSLKGKYENLKS